MLSKSVFKVEGMECQDEVGLIKKVLSHQEGILDLSFDLLSSKLIVEYESSMISLAQITKLVSKTGMHVSLWQGKQKALDHFTYLEKHGKLLMLILSGTFLALGFLTNHLMFSWILKTFSKEDVQLEAIFSLVSTACLLVSIICGSWYIVPKAFFSIRKVRADMNFLMVVAVIGAMLINQWFEAATVVFLFSLSLMLEHATLSKARKAIAKLLDLSPKKATVIENGKHVVKDVHEVNVDDRIFIKASDQVPLDGVIVQGATLINQAPITGEPIPQSKGVGQEVFAGTINVEAPIECRVTKPFDETTLSKMLFLIEEAHSKRAVVDKWVEKFASIYTPVMIGIAVFIAIIPPLLFHVAFVEWLYRALVIIVVACPCALVISTPVSIISGLTAAARYGVLIKGGAYLEIPSRLRVIAFDKTGTLTHGKPTFNQLLPQADIEENKLLSIAATLETASHHPISKAILEHAHQMGALHLPMQDAKVFPGKGVQGKVDGIPYWIGSHRFLHELGIETKHLHETINSLEDAGHSVIILGSLDKVLGILTVSDREKEDLSQMIEGLKAEGIEKVVMLTGDNTQNAKALATSIGVDEFFSELLPEDKLKAIESLVSEFEYVCMVGDGINDAPAMAAASMGIAMGVMGSDVAIEAADIALMTDDLTKLPWIIKHSKTCIGVIKQNVFFALSTKVVVFGLAIFGSATLWMAIAADAGASLIVVFNALRLLKSPQKADSSVE